MSSIEPASLKVVELRAELSNRNLPTKGKKDELIARLTEALEAEKSAEQQPAAAAAEEVVEKSVEQVIETPVEEVIEKPTEEVLQKPMEEVIETSTEKPIVEEPKDSSKQIVKEPAQQVIEKPKETIVENSEAITTKSKEKGVVKSQPVSEQTIKKQQTPEKVVSVSDNMESDSERGVKRARSDDNIDQAEDKRAKVQDIESSALYIKGFIRPLVLRTVNELISKYGNVKTLWMDSIKTHCYVIYETSEEAQNAYKGINGVTFPHDTGKPLSVGGLTPEQAEELIDYEKKCQERREKLNWESNIEKIKAGERLIVEGSPDTGRRARNISIGQIAKQLAQANNNEPSHNVAASRGDDITRDNVTATNRDNNARETIIESNQRYNITSLDDIFCKTEALPHLYYLPNSDAVAKSKLEQSQKS